jgi:hypothetical protein
MKTDSLVSRLMSVGKLFTFSVALGIDYYQTDRSGTMSKFTQHDRVISKHHLGCVGFDSVALVGPRLVVIFYAFVQARIQLLPHNQRTPDDFVHLA